MLSPSRLHACTYPVYTVCVCVHTIAISGAGQRIQSLGLLPRLLAVVKSNKTITRLSCWVGPRKLQATPTLVAEPSVVVYTRLSQCRAMVARPRSRTLLLARKAAITLFGRTALSRWFSHTSGPPQALTRDPAPPGVTPPWVAKGRKIHSFLAPPQDASVREMKSLPPSWIWCLVRARRPMRLRRVWR